MQLQAQQTIADSVLKNTLLLIEALKDNYRQYSIRGHQRAVENYDFTYDGSPSVQSQYHLRKIEEGNIPRAKALAFKLAVWRKVLLRD